jgi:hypothetical protein
VRPNPARRSHRPAAPAPLPLAARLVAAGALALLPALLLPPRPAGADHYARSTLVCAVQVSVIPCTLTIGPFSGTVLSNERLTVTLAGAVELDPATPPRVAAVGPAPCTAAVQSGSVTRTSFVVAVGVAGCQAGAAITVSETFVVVGSGGGGLRQTIASPSIEPATITAVAPGGSPFAVPTPLAGSTKVCAWSPATATTSVSCALTLGPLTGLAPGQPVMVRIAIPAAGVSFVAVEAGGGCGMSGPHGLTATSFFVTLTAACAGTDVLVLRETLAVTVADGTPLCQTVAAGALLPVQVCAVTPAGTPFSPRNPAAAAPVSVTAVCVPLMATPGAALPPPRAGEPLSCTVTATALPPPEGDARLAGPARVTLTAARFLDGTTAGAFDCAALTLGAPAAVGSPARGATCGFTVVLVPAAACTAPTLVVELFGATFRPPLLTPSGQPLTVLPAATTGAQGCPGAPAPPGEPPATLALSCAHSPGVAWLLAQDEVPALPEAVTRAVGAVAMLPEVVSCRARLLNAAGEEGTAPPGTVRLSTLAGGLLDAGGRAVTLLPVPCGGVELATLRPSACTGVDFSLAGTRVGVVEVRARYEPGMAAPGTPALEGTVQVAFVAPAVSVRLSASREPLTPGTSGRARATLSVIGRLCRLAACVDPATGAPLWLRPGSALNGDVLFISDAPAVVTWAAVDGTGTQTAVRCGRPRESMPAGGAALADYFRGCASASAAFRAGVAGEAGLSAVFVPDLPGASVAAVGSGPPWGPVAALTRFFAGLAAGEDSVVVVVEEARAPP